MFRIKLWDTDRGFVRGDFVDLYGESCSIQESSLATDDCVWLGVNEHRMHLTQEMAAELIPLLQEFVDTGRLQ